MLSVSLRGNEKHPVYLFCFVLPFRNAVLMQQSDGKSPSDVTKCTDVSPTLVSTPPARRSLLPAVQSSLKKLQKATHHLPQHYKHFSCRQ